MKRWTVIIDIDADEPRTHATARLLTHDSDRLLGFGSAWRTPMDDVGPTARDELAAAHALAEISRKLTATAEADPPDHAAPSAV